MKKTISILSTVLLATLTVVGVSYVQAWTGPSVNPPEGNTPAPVNVSSVEQVKDGGLSLGALLVNAGSQFEGLSIFNGGLRISDGSEGDGKVLVSDSDGNASWRASSSGRMCTVIDTKTDQPDGSAGNWNYFKVNLVMNNKNICEGLGCMYTLIRYSDVRPQGYADTASLGQEIRFRQVSSGDWVDYGHSSGNGASGINGDSQDKKFVSNDYMEIYDDFGTPDFRETLDSPYVSKDYLTIREKNNDNFYYLVTFCEF